MSWCDDTLQAALPCGGVKPYLGSWLTVPHPVSEKVGIQMSQCVRSTALREVDFFKSINTRVRGAECSSVSCLRCTARGLFEPLLADMSPSCVHSSSPRLRQTEYAIGCNSLTHVEAICVGTRRGWSRRGATTHAKPGHCRYWPPTAVITCSGPHAWYVRPATKWGSRSSGLFVSSAHVVCSSRRLISSAHFVS